MKCKLVVAAVVTFSIGVAVSTVGYWDGQQVPLQDLEAPRPAAAPSPPVAADPIRVLLAGMWSPTTGHRRLGQFIECLEETTGDHAAIVLREQYAQGLRMLLTRRADLGLLCSGAAATAALSGELKESHEIRFRIARDGVSVYSAVLVVRKEDPAQDLLDLEGAEMAWTDPDSLTGFLALRAHLRSLEIDPNTFFSDSTFTYGHERSIHDVQSGLVRAAVVDEMFLRSGDPEHALRSVWRSQPFPAPPFVVDKRREDLSDALARLADEPRCLQALGANGLAPASWEDYGELAEIVVAGR